MVVKHVEDVVGAAASDRTKEGVWWGGLKTSSNYIISDKQ